jgi:hypothetical protein
LVATFFVAAFFVTAFLATVFFFVVVAFLGMVLLVFSKENAINVSLIKHSLGQINPNLESGLILYTGLRLFEGRIMRSSGD